MSDYVLERIDGNRRSWMVMSGRKPVGMVTAVSHMGTIMYQATDMRGKLVKTGSERECSEFLLALNANKNPCPQDGSEDE